MSGKALRSLKDENPDLQKQIGCITGFFQLFERHRFLTGQRTSNYLHHRPSTSGDRSNDIKEHDSRMQKAKAKNVKIAREKHQFSTESSITSLSSSSCSSSMSSYDFNRTIQLESLTNNRVKIPENSNSEVARKQLDFYGIIKDSMHREPQGLSVKTAAKDEKMGQNKTHTLKHVDSPRPLRSHKSANAGVIAANEPFSTLAKSKKAPWDSPRLSYDGRDTQDTFKSAPRHKDLPRLSLDSRERSMRGFNEGNKLKGPQKGYVKNSSTILNQLQVPETSRRSSSVVAKLMGLEALPDSIETCETPLRTSSCSNQKNELLARSSTIHDDKQHQSSVSSVTPYSRLVLESTPWRQPDVSRSSKLQASKGHESDMKASRSSSLTVYGEIEKRLAELEFKKSGKDLRALKQILEAMQRYKDSLDVARDQASNSPSNNRNDSSLNKSSKIQTSRAQQTYSSKLPIVIMKPARITTKANNTSSTEFSVHGKSGLSKCSPSNPTNGRLVDKQKGINSTTKNIKDPFGQPIRSLDKNNSRASKVLHDSKGENTTNSITVTGSPRLQKKFGLERRSPPASPLNIRIDRREHNKQLVEFSSPNTTPRQKFSTLQERNESSGEISCHWKDFKHHVNVISPDFDHKRSSAVHSELKVIRIDQSGQMNSTSIQLSSQDQNNAYEELRKENFKSETVVTTEQPSPVSVLDASFYREDPPSPMKKKSDISKNLGETLSTDDDSEENSVDLSPLSNTTKANFSNEPCDRIRDLKSQDLVHILQQIDWIDEKFINVNNSKDPDHKYITEILLASGLLSGHSSSQTFHSPGHLINPKLFFALEQMKTEKDTAKKIDSIINSEQMQRKVIFDVVNDILVQKVILESSSTLWCIPNKLVCRKLKGQQLLNEICTEIDQLQPQNRNFGLLHEDEDLKHHHTVWTKCCSEIPNVVLDIERLIFKDLITEVVRGELANHPGTHCRQRLFPK